MLSGYRIMWLIVMFDLPVVKKEERKAASDFRNRLLDMGFEMSQFSVYMRFCTSATQVETYCRRIEEYLPFEGRVHILQLTDKQYERILTFRGKVRDDPKKIPDQYVLF